MIILNKKNVSKHNPDYPYVKNDITADYSPEGYPIIERTVNALLFPEGPQDGAEFKEMK